MLAFADPDVIKMLQNDYIPVALEDWYYRRKRDAEGKFFWTLSGSWGTLGDGETRQQLTCMAADGTVFSRKNEGQFPEQVRERLRQGLREFQNLPEERRKPDAVKVEELTEPDLKYTPPTPPEGGLIVKAYTRSLDRDAQGRLRHATLDNEIKKSSVDDIIHLQYWKAKEAPQPDFLWLTQEEVKSLIPAPPKPGGSVPLPESIAYRICRFHLQDSTWEGAAPWKSEDVRSAKFTLTVEEATPEKIRLRLEGAALMATAPDPAKADRSYNARLLGYVEFDTVHQKCTRFDAVALGEHASEKRPRKGRHPLGISFELIPGDRPADRVPPAATLAGRLGKYLEGR